MAAGFEFDEGAMSFVHGGCYGDGEGDRHLGQNAEAHVVLRSGVGEVGLRRTAKTGNDLGAGGGKVFSGTDVEGHPVPAPVLDLELKGRVGLHGGVGGYALFVFVAEELA